MRPQNFYSIGTGFAGVTCPNYAAPPDLARFIWALARFSWKGSIVQRRQEKQAQSNETISVTSATQETSKDNVPRKKRRDRKDEVRLRFLRRLPKGGRAVEIGVWQGEFSATILRELKCDHLCLIDPWANVTDESHAEAFAGRTADGKMEKIYQKVQDRYASEIEADKVSIIRDFSVPALAGFEDDSLSFAYVDGDHSFEGVSADLEALFPKMKVGGVMAFDDYHRRGWWGDGVIRAINLFLGKHPEKLRIRAIVGAQIGIEKIEG